jgi:hypothetical protein
VDVSALSLWKLAPDSYQSHTLHRSDRAWSESNCYIDLWVEVLHTLGRESFACLPFTVAVDFEGDQWTFAKPPLGDLFELYGVVVEELSVWRPLLAHSEEQLRLGRLVVTEADAFYLPDTSGTDYRLRHNKTTIGIEQIDAAADKLGYFHNGGYHALEGSDFQGTFRRHPDATAALPLYAEIAKFDHLQDSSDATLLARSLALLGKHLGHRPATNPIRRFGARLQTDLAWLTTQELATFHTYAFVTVRQLGASYELAALYLRWLAAQMPSSTSELCFASADFLSISTSAKTLILKLARVANTRRAADFSPLFEDMADHWDSAMETLVASQTV